MDRLCEACVAGLCKGCLEACCRAELWKTVNVTLIVDKKIVRVVSGKVAEVFDRRVFDRFDAVSVHNIRTCFGLEVDHLEDRSRPTTEKIYPRPDGTFFTSLAAGTATFYVIPKVPLPAAAEQHLDMPGFSYPAGYQAVPSVDNLLYQGPPRDISMIDGPIRRL